MQTQIIESIKAALWGLIVYGLTLLTAGSANFIFQPNLVWQQTGDIVISNTDSSQAFYDELQGSPRSYTIDAGSGFDLYLNVLTPELVNGAARYSIAVYLQKDDGTEEQLSLLYGPTAEWKEYYESFSREYYMKGPELDKNFPAGKYRIEISSLDNIGKYVLASGKTKTWEPMGLFSLYWKLPKLKMDFFKTSIWQLAFSPLMIAIVIVVGLILLLIAIINYIVGLIQLKIRQAQAKTILLTSGGMLMKSEISKLLQKPAYNITVAFIVTAGKTGEKVEYLKNDYMVMRDMGFNVLEIDIEGKTEKQVREMIQLRDIIFVEDGNAFMLLKAMRKCNFEKIMRELLKLGKVYLGVGSGSMVAGKSIRIAEWLGQENEVNLRGYKGLNLVPFEIFPHYTPEQDILIKKKVWFKWRRRKIKFLTDKQAVLSQGKSILTIGEGNKIEV